ncbi:MAG: phenylacetate--CoA ligase family protein [Desulfobulbaceae bacterium]|nr:phenylacetate--CoA ligase family protein [Desulfobulbaceae bacterium]
MNPCPLDTWTRQRLHLSGRPLTRADLTRYHNKALQELVRHCSAHSAFYRRTWAGLNLGNIQGIADLHRLPCTSETELRQQGQAMLCVSQDAVARIMTLASSGSTGAAKRLFFTADDLEHTRDFFHHGMLHLLQPGERVAIFLPGDSPDSTGALLAEALNRVPAPCRIFGMVEDLMQGARQLASWQASVLVGLPVQMLALVRMARHLGCVPASLRSALLCSDYVAHSICTALSGQFGCAVFSHYGSVESGLGAAVDCSAHNGLHVRESDIFFEIVDECLRPLPPGEWGEIVLTTLSRRGMPLVRYRSGDWGRLLPGVCSCGSTLVRLDQVRGRMAGFVSLTKGGQLSLATLDEALFSLPGLLDFQAGLWRGSSDEELLQVRLSTLPGHEQSTLEQARTILASTLSHLCGLPVQLHCSSNPEIMHVGKRQLHNYRENSGNENTY